MIRPAVHLMLHVLLPGVCARIFFKQNWWKAWVIMVLTWVVDLDHLLSVPVYDPNRCSINYHPLHSYPAIGVYLVLAAIPKTRIVGLGLLIHMGLDYVDCVWQFKAGAAFLNECCFALLVP